MESTALLPRICKVMAVLHSWEDGPLVIPTLRASLVWWDTYSLPEHLVVFIWKRTCYAPVKVNPNTPPSPRYITKGPSNNTGDSGIILTLQMV